MAGPSLGFWVRLSEWPGWIIRFLKDAVVSRGGVMCRTMGGSSRCVVRG